MAQEGYDVVLNVYDLSQGLAFQLSGSFLGKAIEGIWHTGVVVYGKEYYFGGGIQSCSEGQSPYGKPIRVVQLGRTEIPQDVFESYLKEISPRFSEQTYSLLYHNCNNFSDEVSQFLVGCGIPDFILKLPQEVMSSPMGALIMPMIQQFEMILKHGGVPQVPQLRVPQVAQQVPKMPSVAALTSPSPSASTAAARTAVDFSTSDSSVLKVTEGSTNSGGKNAKNAIKESASSDAVAEARVRVQEEITREFAALMAQGHLRASEAAALAARRVMERHGKGDAALVTKG